MAKWLRNTFCPGCGSKDNRAIYDDGSEHCWGNCGYFKRGNVIEAYQKRSREDPFYIFVKLPEDVINILPPKAQAWLNKYSLTKEELATLGPLYSYEEDLLIFPIYEDHTKSSLLMWQGRYFGPKKDHPKYITRGSKDHLHILGPDSGTIVVVEDLISAVKIASITTVLPLFCASLSPKVAKRLSDRYKELVIWLDPDKSVEAFKIKERYKPLFNKIHIVVTTFDPKDYTHEELVERLDFTHCS